MHPVFQKLAQESGRRTLVMGVLNITPDSFSDGGQFLRAETALEHARKMLEDGADLLDLGGESTRPGAQPISQQEELDRVLPVARLLKKELPQAVWSIDTQKSVVAEQALGLGACMVNDVSALRADGGMAAVVARAGCGLVLMHRLGEPVQMKWSTQEDHSYEPEGVVQSVLGFLLKRAGEAEAAGIHRGQIWLDPGFGFGKNVADNLSLLKHLDSLVASGYRVLMGTSRKSTLGAVLGGLAASDRLEGTAATVAMSAWMGAACVRVHDVKEMARVVRMVQAVKDSK